jgi:hypothetical protein
MPWRFRSVGIPTFVCVDGVFCYEINIAFIELNHSFWQSKNGQAINSLMSKESPGA